MAIPGMPPRTGRSLAAAGAVVAGGFAAAVLVVAVGRGQLSARAVLVGKPDQWYANYLMQPASAYQMPDAEGLSSTVPFKDPPYGGPLHLLHQMSNTQASRQLAVRNGAGAAGPVEHQMKTASQQLCGLDSVRCLTAPLPVLNCGYDSHVLLCVSCALKSAPHIYRAVSITARTT
jgi:hypothetical protein